MKLYTGSGDGGDTSLLRGQKVSKGSLDIDALGELDELNAVIGLCRAHPDVAKHPFLDQALERVQNVLFEMGAELAGAQTDGPWITQEEGVRLESVIDRLTEMTPPIRFFILPAGCEGACRLHLARAVARRAERALVRLSGQRTVNTASLIVLNRLSDLLFAAARFVNMSEEVPEQAWHGKT